MRYFSLQSFFIYVKDSSYLVKRALNTSAMFIIVELTEWKASSLNRARLISTVCHLKTEPSQQIIYNNQCSSTHYQFLMFVMFVKALINPCIDLLLITLHTHNIHANRLTGLPSGLEEHTAAVLRLIHPPNLSSLTSWRVEVLGNKHRRVSADGDDMEHTLHTCFSLTTSFCIFHRIYYKSHKL